MPVKTDILCKTILQQLASSASGDGITNPDQCCSSAFPKRLEMADFADVLAQFALVEEPSRIDKIVQKETSETVVVLLHRKDREYKTKPFLNTLAFLFRERTDLVRART
jgi:hypothetical protein